MEDSVMPRSSGNPLESWKAYLEYHLLVVGSAEAHAMGSTIDQIVKRITAKIVRGGRLIVAGNGGSASDANHIVGELVASFAYERRGIDAISLSANSTVLTAWANDYGETSIFSRQVEAHMRQTDVLLLLSTSGNSANIVEAAQVGKQIGGYVVGLTGQGPNELMEICDDVITASSNFTPTVQEFHVVVYHYLCSAIEFACLLDQEPVARYTEF